MAMQVVMSFLVAVAEVSSFNPTFLPLYISILYYFVLTGKRICISDYMIQSPSVCAGDNKHIFPESADHHCACCVVHGRRAFEPLYQSSPIHDVDYLAPSYKTMHHHHHLS
jgi:hypothetical protein